MATAALRRAMTAFTRPPDPSDTDLLRQFAAGRSEDAFAALVRRHGPLVLGVCRRVVPDRHLADDAFQAAFVVLARRAGGIDPARPLGPWLYGVAHRVALRARTMLGKRRKRETLTASVPEIPKPAPVADDAAAVLDEEIAKLPPAARDAVILCELQGLSRREAANRLGIAEGTLSSRLAAARKTLAAKLHSRGVVLSVALAGAAVVSPQLASAAVAAGTGTALSSVVVSLADGASAMTLFNKLKLTGVAVLFLLLSAGGVGPWGANESAAAPVPKAKPEGELLWVLNDITFELKAFSPGGKLVKELKLPEGDRFLGLTPDGQKIAFAGKKGKVADPKETDGLTVHLRDIGTDTEGTDTGLECRPKYWLVWSPDGSKVISVGASSMYDLATRKRTELKLPADHQCWQWAPDGSWLLVRSGDDVKPANWFKYTLADGKLTPIATNFPCYRVDVSPDGRHLIGYAHRISMPGGIWREDRTLLRVDVNTGNETPLAEFAEPAGYGYGWARWSPDGKRLAFWCSVRTKPDDPVDDMHLSICDADTGERKTIATLPYNPWVLQGWFPDARKIKAPVPKQKAVALLWTHNAKSNTLTAYTADGREAKRVQLPDGVPFFGFTPDGTRMAFGGTNGKGSKDADGRTLHVGDISEKCEGEDTGIACKPADRFVWSPDGKRVVRGTKPAEWTTQWVHTLHDLAAKTSEVVKLPRDHQLHQWSADGKTWRVWHTNHNADGNLPFERWLTTPAGAVDLTPVCDDGWFVDLDPHPDGRRFLAVGHNRPFDSKPAEQHLFGVESGKAAKLATFSGVSSVTARWSPDGRRIACLKHSGGAKLEDAAALADSTLVLLDADGTNETTVQEFKADWQTTRLLGWFPVREPIMAPVPKGPPPEGVFLAGKLNLSNKSELIEVVGTDGKSDGHLALGELHNVQQVRVSPDGKRLAFVRFVPLSGPKGNPKYAYPVNEVYVVDLPLSGPPKEPVMKGLLEPSVAWAADSKSLFVSRIPAGTDVDQDSVKGKLVPKETVRYDVAAKKEAAVKLPDGHVVLDVSADGKTLLTGTLVWHPNVVGRSNYLVPLDTLKPKLLGDEDDGFDRARLSPDGTRVVGTRVAFSRSKDLGLFVADVASGKVEKVGVIKEMADGLFNGRVAWAPDGKRVAVLWMGAANGKRGGPGGGGAPGGFGGSVKRLTVMDADGKNDKTVHEFDDSVIDIDWADPKLTEPKKDAPKAKPPVKGPITAPVPKATADGGLIWTHCVTTGTLTAYTPDGTEAKKVKLPEASRVFRGFTPDGTRMAFIGKGDSGLSLHVGPIDDSGTGTDTGLGCEAGDEFVWSPDAKQVVRERLEKVGNRPLIHHSHVLYDLAAKTETTIDLPADHQIMQWSADGKTWGVLHNNLGQDPTLPNYRWLTAPVADKPAPKPVCDTHAFLWLEPTADGNGWLGGGWKHTGDGNIPVFGLHAVAGGKATGVVDMGGVVFANFRRSPDGTRVVCGKAEYDPATKKLGDTTFVLFDAAGRNESKLFVIENDLQATRLVGWFPTPIEPKGKPPAK